MYNRRWQQQTGRSDRWKREDDAPRLHDEVPELVSLRMSLEEWGAGMSEPIAGTKRVRHIVVQRAGALFEFPCSDTKCEEGHHELTDTVLAALRRRELEFEGDSVCEGTREGEPCGHRLHYSAEATYTAAAP
jgi:hypothetical protein